MAALPLPPKETTNRELLSLARRIERYGVQRRKLLVRVDELQAQILEAKRSLRELADLIASPELVPSPLTCCAFHRTGGGPLLSCGVDVQFVTSEPAR